MSLATLDPPAPAATAGPSRPRAWSSRVVAHPNWLSFVAYGISSLGSNWPIWPGDGSRLPTCGCGDIDQTLWYLRYTPYALAHGKNLFATHLMEYPRGVDLAQNTAIWLLGLVTAPLTVTVNAVASMNLLRWLAFTLSAYSMYWVLRHFVRFAPAAFFGGLLYGFSPYLVTQATLHLDLTFVPLPPLVFYALYQLVVVQRAPAWRSGLGLGLLATAQFFISAEVLTTTGVLSAIALAVLFLTCVREVPSHWRRALVGLVVAAAVLALCAAYPYWMMLHGPDHYVGPAQGYNNPFSGDLLGAVVPTGYQRFAPRALKRVGDLFVQRNIHEDDQYLGIPLLLMAGYLLVRYWRRLWLVYLALLAVSAYVLSLGWELVVDRRVVKLPFDMPFLKLEHFPFIANIEPARFALYTMFFVACLVALGLDAYADDVRARRLAAPGSVRSRRVVAGRAAGAVLFVFVVAALVPDWPSQSVSVAQTESITTSMLRVVPRGALVLTYPFASPYTAQPLFWQEEAGMAFRLVGGYALTAGVGRGSEYPHRLAPVEIESIFQESALATPSAILPIYVATRQSVDAQTTSLLREFLRANHVTAVVVDMADRDAGEVAVLVRLALGRPQSSSATVEIWTHVPRLLARPARRERTL